MGAQGGGAEIGKPKQAMGGGSGRGEREGQVPGSGRCGACDGTRAFSPQKRACKARKVSARASKVLSSRARSAGSSWSIVATSPRPSLSQTSSSFRTSSGQPSPTVPISSSESMDIIATMLPACCDETRMRRRDTERMRVCVRVWALVGPLRLRAAPRCAALRWPWCCN